MLDAMPNRQHTRRLSVYATSPTRAGVTMHAVARTASAWHASGATRSSSRAGGAPCVNVMVREILIRLRGYAG